MKGATKGQAPSPLALFDSLCDAEQLHGLIMAAELTMEQIGDAENWRDSRFRVISKQDEKTLLALLRPSRQLAEKLEADLGVLA